MNKKLKPLISIALIIIISIPVFSIVFARKPDKGPLEKIVFIHYKKEYGKPDGKPGKPLKDDKGDYTLLVKGAKWPETPIDYVIDETFTSDRNPYGLPIGFITGAIFNSTEEWDSWTSADLFGSCTIDESADWDGWEDSDRDYRNEISFGDYPQPGVIAVAVVWGYFGGPPSGRYILEFDIMFDTDYKWGYTGITIEEDDGIGVITDTMDLWNIATHELGHGLGLGDLYKPRASEETMYGYSRYGETQKRTLNDGDIAGIQFLYGPYESE